MEASQRIIVESQEKKLNYIKNYSNNLLTSMIKSKKLELIQMNTNNCIKVCVNNIDNSCFYNCINKRYQISELLLDVK